MEMANITYQDEDGNIKVRIDHDKCISCGRCVLACKHNARYYLSDMERFFEDLSKGVPISLIAAPSIRSNIYGYKRLFTYLKRLGVNKIYDVSLGADICIWAHFRYLEKTNFAPIITQPCPVIVTYCELYRSDLLDKLSPVQSPMACASIYITKYQGITDRIAALSPCIAKMNEFHDTNLAQYNVTFTKLLEYIKENNITLPDEETDFDHDESGLGSLFPIPGGLKENLEFLTGRPLFIIEAEGFSVYEKLDTYAQTPRDLLPEVFDVLNCIEGCNVGPASTYEHSIFEIGKTMHGARTKATGEGKMDHYKKTYEIYDETFELTDFLRKYKPASKQFPQITDEDISKAFELLGKTDFEKQNIDCGACGSETCHNMARKIALGVNIPGNCIVKSKEDAKTEHEQNILAHEQLVDMEKMHEADKRMRIMLDTNPHINVLFNSSFKMIDCNPAAIQFMGFETKEAMLAGFVERLAKSIPAYQPDGRASLTIAQRFMTAAKEGHIKFETEMMIGAVTKTVEIDLERIPYEHSFAIVGYVYDMTDIHRREMELTHAHELNKVQLIKLDLMVQAAKIGLWDMEVIKNDPINPDNAFTWSDEFRHLLGYTNEDDFPNVLNSWSNCIHPDDRDRILDLFEKHLLDKTGRTPYDLEYRMRKKNGEYAYYRDCGETIRDADGDPIRVAGALLDVTETKNLIDEAEKQRIEADAANKAKTSFLSTMSHEIRTPMNAILGVTEIQLLNEALDSGMRDALYKIYTSSDILLGIINDILDLSKIEAGKLELVVDKYEIASLISDTAQLNMMRIGSKAIEFELSVDENLPAYLSGDELRVKQILNNLLSNAFKYTSEGIVKLSVTAEKIDGNSNELILVVVVSDTGQGMTPEQISKLFEEFTRFNVDANRTTEGTGLGMSITQNLVQMMNGEISVESELGKGSVFTVRLPQGIAGIESLGKNSADNLGQFRTSSRAQMRRVQITREPMPYGNVLIVDDVEMNIYVAMGLMAPYGLTIDSADSGMEAIRKIERGNTYDIIFMDHMMPKMDGVEATKIIRDMGYSGPIVALTANAVTGQADSFLKNGFDDFISKPVDLRHLNTILNRLIRDKQPPEIIAKARMQAQANNIDGAKMHSDDDGGALMQAEVIQMAEGQSGAGKAAEGQTKSGVAPRPALSPRFAEIFTRDANKALAILEPIAEKNSYDNEEDIRSYTINVHGMKSALANVGEAELSEAALKLEIAVREGKIDLIRSQTPAFIHSLRAFTESLKPKEEAVDRSASDEDKRFLAEKLLVIGSACKEYDESAADEALSALLKKTWPQKTQELLDKIAVHLLHSDFDEIVDEINRRQGDGSFV